MTRIYSVPNVIIILTHPEQITRNLLKKDLTNDFI